MSETVVVTDVSETTSPKAKKKVFHIQLEDGRTPTTLNENIAAAARDSMGNAVPARINESKRGDFTNLYLNEINGVKDKPAPKRDNGAAPSSRAKDEFQEKRQRTIEREWAYGQAISMLVGSGHDFPWPLDATTRQELDDEAQMLLNRLAS